jgi:condensin complex subunit 1
LSSKTIQDTVETIKVFRLLYTYGVQESIFGIKKMVTLVFSKD